MQLRNCFFVLVVILSLPACTVDDMSRPGSGDRDDDSKKDHPHAPTALSNGVCDADRLPDGIFDPDCVYLEGTLEEGANFRDAITRVEGDGTFVTGFVGGSSGYRIRPTDGRVLYNNAGGRDLRIFEPDKVSSLHYPKNPSDNDKTVDTPACGTLHSKRTFLSGVFPDGVAIYGCQNDRSSQAYVEATDTSLGHYSRTVIAFGPNRRMLAERRSDTDTEVVVVAGGNEHPVHGLGQFRRVSASRYVNDHFYIVTSEGDHPAWTLWAVDDHGKAEKHGKYVVPDDERFPPLRCALVPNTDMYCFAWEDAIIKLSLTAAPEMVFHEDDSSVKIHISRLFTGP